MLLLKLLLIAACLTAKLCAAADFHYPDMDTDETFPSWGGLCDSGEYQSPIDLSMKSMLLAEYKTLQYINYKSTNKRVSMINNGHTVQLYDFPREMKLHGGPLLNEFILEQIHFHWWSEHTFEGMRFPLEAHLVHRNKSYDNLQTAMNSKGGVSVVGILFHVSNEPNTAIQRIVDQLDEISSYKQINKPTQLKGELVVHDLFPVTKTYITYKGSLTTPNCAEDVRWIVLKETYPVSLEQVMAFKEIEYAENKQLKNNYRYLQKSNHRPVLLVKSGATATVLAAIHKPLMVFMVLTGFVKYLLF